MRILGIGIAELAIIAVVGLIVIAIIIALIVKLSKPKGSQKSSEAYQRLAQLDDLRKRGAITEEEYELKKQEAMRDI